MAGIDRVETGWQADIAKAYRSLALRYHPDKNRDKVKDAEASRMFSEMMGICTHVMCTDRAQVGFKRISEAYSVLRDPQKRVE